MIAEDHATSKSSAKALYQIIKGCLCDPKLSRENVLPIVYVVDSILKNARGQYITLIEDDASDWLAAVYPKLQQTQKLKLKKVWKTWNDYKIFAPESLKVMNQCFASDEPIGSANVSVVSTLAGGGTTISRKVINFLVHVILSGPP